MNEVLELPKGTKIEHSKINGTFNQYQNDMTQLFFDIIKNLKDYSLEISKKCEEKISEKMIIYKTIEENLIKKIKNILSQTKTGEFTFEEMYEKIEKYGKDLQVEGLNLKNDIIFIYEDFFQKIKPKVDQSYLESKDIIPKVLPQYSTKLDEEVKRLNESFLSNKIILLNTLTKIENNSIFITKQNLDELIKFTEEWKDNRFNKLVNDAKIQLDLYYPINFENIFENFFNEQNNFTQCFTKLLQTVTIISPPDHFHMNDLNNWFKEVESIIEFHHNFISQFLTKITEKIYERNLFNTNLYNSLETKLLQLKDENDTFIAMSELTPLYKQSQKFNLIFLEKLTKFWEIKKENLKKSFLSIKEFLNPLVQIYEKFIDDSDISFKNINNNILNLREKSENDINKFNIDLDSISNEIFFLANEKDIFQKVEECKLVLSKIEMEYRNYYQLASNIYDSQYNIIGNFFNNCENELISKLKLKKTANSPEFESPVKNSPNSGRGPSKKPVIRTIRRPTKSKAEISNQQKELFSILLPNGAKFEEIEPIIIIPNFEDYSEGISTPLPSSKSRGRAKSPVQKIKRVRGGLKNSKTKGKNEEIEEIEIPEFSLFTSVPKVKDDLSINIYIPQNNELENWINLLRQEIMKHTYNNFSNYLKKSQYLYEKTQIADELNERIRKHTPRINSIELNIAQNRVLQIESRKVQIEKHLRHIASQFNKQVLQIESERNKFKEELIQQTLILKEISNQLFDIKSTSGFSTHTQQFHIKQKQIIEFFQNKKLEQIQKIKNSMGYYKSTNERFVEIVILNNETFSKEEKDNFLIYFEKMNHQIDTIIQELVDQLNNVYNEIELNLKSIIDEFEQTLSHHKSDVLFIETFNLHLAQTKTRYETLIFRNRQQEFEIEHLIQEFNNLPNNSNNQSQILFILDYLDRLRISLIKRSKYLMILKSDLNIDKLTFTVDLNNQTSKFENRFSELSQNSNEKKKNVRPKSKVIQNNKMKMTPSMKKLPENTEIIQSFQGQIELISNQFITSLTKLSSEYYLSLRTRKFNITRTNLILSNQQEFIELMKTEWNNHISNSNKIINESSIKFRTQISMSTNIVKDSILIIYYSFNNFYINFIKEEQLKIQIEFDTNIREHNIKRNKLKDFINPKFLDINNEFFFLKIIEEEKLREEQEIKLLLTYENSIYNCEKHFMTLYTTHLPVLVSQILILLDKFVLLDDLFPGQSENVLRKTLNEMLKDQTRKNLNDNNNERPFQLKSWPSLPIIMSPLSILNSFNLNNYNDSNKNNSNNKNSSRKKRKPEKSISTPIENFNIELMPILNSYDTNLNRFAIVERNKTYEYYQEKLKIRINNLK